MQSESVIDSDNGSTLEMNHLTGGMTSAMT
jgi:hypothetical protein